MYKFSQTVLHLERKRKGKVAFLFSKWSGAKTQAEYYEIEMNKPIGNTKPFVNNGALSSYKNRAICMCVCARKGTVEDTNTDKSSMFVHTAHSTLVLLL